MTKRSILLICGSLLLAAAVAVGILIMKDRSSEPLVKTEIKPTLPAATGASTTTATATVAATTASAAETDPTEPVPTATRPKPDVSNLDFAALKAINPDIYAWLEIEGSQISFPIVQNEADGDYYLTHNSDGKPDRNGAIFTEHEYNSTDFSDPVTVIYGHNMRSGAMFGTLRKTYTDSGFLKNHPYITVYTEQATLRYGVFAAVPYNSHHILYSYDFSEPTDFNLFFSRVYAVRDVNTRFVTEYQPHPGDRVIILSTCFNGSKQRFLVMATLLP